DQLLKDIVEPFGFEIALLLGDPLVQPEVRFDDEFLLDHGRLLTCQSSVRAQQQALAPRLSRCSATRRAAIIFTCSSISRRAPAPSRISISDANSLWALRTRRATAGVRVGLCAGHDTCCSEMSCTTSTRLCDASATPRWNSRETRVNAPRSSILRSA